MPNPIDNTRQKPISEEFRSEAKNVEDVNKQGLQAAKKAEAPLTEPQSDTSGAGRTAGDIRVSAGGGTEAKVKKLSQYVLENQNPLLKDNQVETLEKSGTSSRSTSSSPYVSHTDAVADKGNVRTRQGLSPPDVFGKTQERRSP